MNNVDTAKEVVSMIVESESENRVQLFRKNITRTVTTLGSKFVSLTLRIKAFKSTGKIDVTANVVRSDSFLK